MRMRLRSAPIFSTRRRRSWSRCARSSGSENSRKDGTLRRGRSLSSRPRELRRSVVRTLIRTQYGFDGAIFQASSFATRTVPPTEKRETPTLSVREG